ncbi:MAG: hypothetical protein AAF738_06440, partial [Bacteroidota bacterium]
MYTSLFKKLPSIQWLAVLFIFLIHHTSFAQINIGGVPTSFSGLLNRTNLPEVVTEEIDLASVRAEDQVRDLQNVPYRFAIPFKVNL